MEIKVSLWLFLLSMVVTGCSNGNGDAAGDTSFLCPEIANLEFSRLGKPDYEDLGYYPLEKLSVSLETGVIQFARNDTLLLEAMISTEEVEDLARLIRNIKSDDKNRIYNSDMSWSVELKLQISCGGGAGDFMVKSYGQNGQTPLEVRKVYRPLLRWMAKFSFEIG